VDETLTTLGRGPVKVTVPDTLGVLVANGVARIDARLYPVANIKGTD